MKLIHKIKDAFLRTFRKNDTGKKRPVHRPEAALPEYLEAPNEGADVPKEAQWRPGPKREAFPSFG